MGVGGDEAGGEAVDFDVFFVEEGFEEGGVLLRGEVDEVEEGELCFGCGKVFVCVSVSVSVCVCM